MESSTTSHRLAPPARVEQALAPMTSLIVIGGASLTLWAVIAGIALTV